MHSDNRIQYNHTWIWNLWSHSFSFLICMLGVLMSDKEPYRASCYMPRSFPQLSIIYHLLLVPLHNLQRAILYWRDFFWVILILFTWFFCCWLNLKISAYEDSNYQTYDPFNWSHLIYLYICWNFYFLKYVYLN